MKGRIVLAILCAAAGVGLANWIDIVYGAFLEPYGYGLRKWEILALAGSALFGLGIVVSLFSDRYGPIVSLVASGVSWTYFAPSVICLPIGHFLWRFHGGAMPVAILIVLAATIFSFVRLRRHIRSRWSPINV
jgi:drug/metabolite transporter (DMT)-like permease